MCKIMSPSAEPLIPSSKNNKSKIENAWAFKVCNQTDNLETDSKTLYYRLLKLKMQSFYIFKAQKRLKQICIFKQQPQKSHGMDILPKNLQIDRSLFASSGMHAMNYFAFLGIFMHQGHRTQR